MWSSAALNEAVAGLLYGEGVIPRRPEAWLSVHTGSEGVGFQLLRMPTPSLGIGDGDWLLRKAVGELPWLGIIGPELGEPSRELSPIKNAGLPMFAGAYVNT